MPQVTVALDRGTWEMLEMARIQEGHDPEWFVQQAITMALDDMSGFDWFRAQLCGKLIAGNRGEISATVSEQHDAALIGWSAEFDIGRSQLIRCLLRNYISTIPDQRSGVDLDLDVIHPPVSKPETPIDLGGIEVDELADFEFLDGLIDPPVSKPETFKYRTDAEIDKDLNREVELSKEVLFASYVDSLEIYLHKVLRDVLGKTGLDSDLDLDPDLRWVDIVDLFEPSFPTERMLRLWRKFVADTVRQRGSFWTDVNFKGLDKEYRAWINRQINL
jgi:hypothetical protein